MEHMTGQPETSAEDRKANVQAATQGILHQTFGRKPEDRIALEVAIAAAKNMTEKYRLKAVLASMI
jgi:hypothetical protein